MRKAALAPWTFLLVAGLTLSGCAKTAGIMPHSSTAAGAAEEIPSSFSYFPDIPIPSGAKVEVDRTLVFGSGETWTGRLVMSTSNSAFQMFDFFKRELPGFGWREITSVRAASSVLTYSRRQRIATVQIEGGTLGGSVVAVTVSPGSAGQPPSDAPDMPGPVEQVQ